jgi:hypothetical protein
MQSLEETSEEKTEKTTPPAEPEDGTELKPDSEQETVSEMDIASEAEPEPEMDIVPDTEPEMDIAMEAEPEPEMDIAPETEPEEVQTPVAEGPELDEDINELLDMLTKDFEESEGMEADSETVSEKEAEPEEVPAAVEASLFSDDDSEELFADGLGDGEEKTEKSGTTTMDDVFQDALSAVAYSSEDESEDDVLALDAFDTEEQVSEEEQEETTPSKEKKRQRKQKPEGSFWKRIFGNIVTDETAELEAQERAAELAGAEEKAKLKEERKQQQEAEKAEKAELAKAEKERKAAEKAEQAAAKSAEKEEKKRLKMEREANEVVGKINPVGATIVMVFFGVICLVIILGTQSFSYSRAVNGAEDSFKAGNYEEAYDAIAGVKVSESAQETADKVRICMQLQRELNSYNNYYKMQMYLEALDSLMKGIRSYDTNKDKADEYGILNQYKELEKQIVSTLESEFDLTEAQAREINRMDDREAYTEKLESIIEQWSVKMKADEK